MKIESVDLFCGIGGLTYGLKKAGWFAYEGNYPYLDMLKKIYSLERIMLDNGIWAYRMK